MPASYPVMPDPAHTEIDTAVLISRQPVLDGHRRVTGYRISYASADPGSDDRGDASADGAATRLFGDIVTVVGLEELTGGSLAHVPVSKRLLLNLGVPPVRPDQVVLRVSYEHALDPELIPILDSLAGRGFALSLYDLPTLSLDPAVLSGYGIVEIEAAAWSDENLRAAVSTVLATRATPLAVGLHDDADYERAKRLGFELFAGSFFRNPRATEVRNVPVGGLETLAAVARMQGSGASIEELEAIIDRDIGLSVKLLRFINSAYFGMRTRVTSIRAAVMMLGARGVSRWAMMVALTGGTAAPVELSIMALTRARMCELLAEGRSDVAADEMFTIGLLSLADALLDTPLDRVLEELPLAEHVSDALLHRSGPAGKILEAVTDYEIGSFTASSVQMQGTGVGPAYLEALRWAQGTVRELG
jgi:c-di-GMP-related signal transduction protein